MHRHNVRPGDNIEVLRRDRAKIHALGIQREVQRADLEAERRRVPQIRGHNGGDTALWIRAGQLEVDDLGVLEVVQTFEGDVLDQVQVLKRRDEVERLNVRLVALQPPGELLGADEVLGELLEAVLVLDVELGELLDTTVVRSDTDPLQRHLAEQHLTHFRWWRVPVHLHRLAEVELGREHTCLFHLPLEGDGEGLVARLGDVGRVDMHYRGRERMPRDRPEHWQEKNHKLNDEENGQDHQCSDHQPLRHKLLLVWRAARREKADRSARLMVIMTEARPVIVFAPRRRVGAGIACRPRPTSVDLVLPRNVGHRLVLPHQD